MLKLRLSAHVCLSQFYEMNLGISAESLIVCIVHMVLSNKCLMILGQFATVKDNYFFSFVTYNLVVFLTARLAVCGCKCWKCTYKKIWQFC